MVSLWPMLMLWPTREASGWSSTTERCTVQLCKMLIQWQTSPPSKSLRAWATLISAKGTVHLFVYHICFYQNGGRNQPTHQHVITSTDRLRKQKVNTLKRQNTISGFFRNMKTGECLMVIRNKNIWVFNNFKKSVIKEGKTPAYNAIKTINMLFPLQTIFLWFYI